MKQCEFVTRLPTFSTSTRHGPKPAIDRGYLCVGTRIKSRATVVALVFMALTQPRIAETHPGDTGGEPFTAEKATNTFPPFVSFKDGSFHDLRAQMAGHESLLAQETRDGDRIAPGILRLRVGDTDADQTLKTGQERLILSRSASVGSVSIVDGSPRSFSFRLSVADAPKSSATVDVAGLHAPHAAGRSERDGVWVAWERTKGVIIVARYRQGTLEECYLYSNGKKERAMSLDDDMSRDRGKVAHRYIAKAMDAASEAVLDAWRQTALADRVTDRKRLRDQARLAYQQARYAAQSQGVDQELDAVAYREALRSTMATMPHEIFPCVPSRHALIVTPVNLLSRRETSPY